jgi:hypothetical protein
MRATHPHVPRANSPERTHEYLIEDVRVRDTIIERNVRYLNSRGLPYSVVLAYVVEAGGDPSMAAPDPDPASA